jgi:peptidoglycan biosynthesis protein MviN/MurJ (putative lipid II flippase)
MAKITKWIAALGPFIAVFGLTIAAIVYGIFRPTNGVEGIPIWARWCIGLCLVFAPWIVGAVWHRKPPVLPPQYAATLQRSARLIWKIMLYIYGCSFIAGSVIAVLLRNRYPWPYLVAPLSFNLILIVVSYLIAHRNSVPGSHR